MGFRGFLAKFGERRLRQIGLRLDDLIHEQYPQLDRALALIPYEEYVARQRRILRANDMALKHTHLPADFQTAQLTNERFITPTILDLEERAMERSCYED